MRILEPPLSNEIIQDLKIGDRIIIHGQIFTGRDATLPKLVKTMNDGEKVLNHWWRLLKSGGKIGVCVPDYDILISRYQ